MRGKLVVGNWKMNGGLRQNDALLGDLRAGWTAPPGRQLAVCVPYPYLWQAQAALSGSAIAWGAQNVSEHAGGAYTGEVSAAMVAEFGCRYAIVGHSERRALYGESDGVVAARLGERIGAVVIAYEPVWAIGTGRTASPAEAQAVHRLLRERLSRVDAAAADVLLLYGGSVKADNAKALFAGADIDGALVGGASLK